MIESSNPVSGLFVDSLEFIGLQGLSGLPYAVAMELEDVRKHHRGCSDDGFGGRHQDRGPPMIAPFRGNPGQSLR